MNQVTHILRKDIRYLRWEICLTLLLAALFALSGAWWAEILWAFAGIFLISRVIHAEAIPGDRQFWLTRPYRRRSLFAAKLAFILLFVNLPLLVAQEVIARIEGFPLLHTVSGLIGNQILILFCISLPVAAIAALTPGFISFLLTMLPILIAGFSLTQFVTPLSMRLLLTPWPEAAEWVWQTLGVAGLAALATCIHWLQYAHRQSEVSRILTCGSAIIGGVAYWLLPWSFPVMAETLIPTHFSKPPSLDITMDTSRPLAVVDPNGRSQRKFTDRKSLHVPLLIRGVPDDAEVRTDAISVRLTGPDGHTSQGVSASSPFGVRRSNTVLIDEIVPMDPSFLDAERGRSVTMHMTLYISVFGDPNIRTFPIGRRPVDAVDGVQCYLGEFAELYCRSAFRWPERLIYAQAADGSLNSLYQLISYSPFPASLRMNPIEEHFTTGLAASATQVTIVSRKPIKHLRRYFDLKSVRFAE